MNGSRLVIGAMSGTSAAGVDAALVRIEGRGTAMSAKLLGHHPHPYPGDLRRAIFRIRDGNEPCALGELARIAREIALAYAAAARGVLEAAGVGSGEVAAIAAHGQTLF